MPDGATIQNSDAFIYGAALTLEWETYLTDWAVLLINVRERGLLGSSVGKFNTQLGLGIKFIIN
ncbi:Conjugative transposon protein TraO [Bacteroidales bacterium Barb7]|nr:Conjugative transposon protein TraO [Bacteroidales bacterium Barb7]